VLNYIVVFRFGVFIHFKFKYILFLTKTQEIKMQNNQLFEHNYSLEQLIEFFTKNNNTTYYLDTSNAQINIYENQDLNSKTCFIFKPLDKDYVLSKINFDKSLSLHQALTTKHENKRHVYNFVKSEVIFFLSENKILPPSLNPILSFKEKEDSGKITVEIS
jgi:hypothetical protein